MLEPEQEEQEKQPVDVPDNAPESSPRPESSEVSSREKTVEIYEDEHAPEISEGQEEDGAEEGEDEGDGSEEDGDLEPPESSAPQAEPSAGAAPPAAGQQASDQPTPHRGGPNEGRRRRRGRGHDRGHDRGQSRGNDRGHDRGQSRHQGRYSPHEGASGSQGEHRPARPAPSRGPLKREILANTSFEETRIAIMENGRLAELLWERNSAESIVGNIYKGVVENVLPGISSAFVNIGFEKNAYLYISDVLGERGAPIDRTLKKGQNIMIQVAKEAIGTKGMKVTMDVSLPGRFLVFTPFQEYVGVSKNILENSERQRLTVIVDRLVAQYFSGKGVVVRTEAEGAAEQDLENEVKYLAAAWEQVRSKFEAGAPPALLHEDLDLTLQVARDILSDEVYVYLLDNKESCRNVQEFVKKVSPDLVERVRHYEAKTPIFKAFNLEPEIEKLRETKVALPNGGSIIVQEAESLCAIDVNTGRFTGSKSQEDTVTQTNIEAAVEVARQLRLRNIGGIIVVDFIDMKKASNRNRVMDAFASAVRADRAKIRILPITRLGLIEMTRERKRESTISLITDECPECTGAGRVLSGETLRIRIQREIGDMTAGRPGGQIRILLHPALADIFKRQQALIERNTQRSVKIQPDTGLKWEDYRIVLE